MPRKNEKTLHYLVKVAFSDAANLDTEHVRRAVEQGVKTAVDNGYLTPDNDETSAFQHHKTVLLEDDPKSLVADLFEALSDASTVVDKDPGEKYAYQATLERASAFLGLDEPLDR